MANFELNCLSKSKIGEIRLKHVTFCSSINCFLITCEKGEFYLADPQIENFIGPISSGSNCVFTKYLNYHDCLIINDNRRLNARREIGGTLLLKTALQQRFPTNSKVPDETEVDVELTNSEASKLLKYLLSPAVKLSTEKSRDLVSQLRQHFSQQNNIKENIDRSLRSKKWSTVTIRGEYGFLVNLFASIVSDLRQTCSRVPVLPVASALLERLNLLRHEPYSFDLNPEGTGYEKGSMVSEAARRMTLAKWPHMNYRWCLPDQMAEAGFYHQPNNFGDDRVMCFMCNVCLACWEPSDEPWSEHERHMPSCSFIREEYTENVPISVTYGSTTALDHGSISDITCVGNLMNCDWLASSTLHGDVVFWNVAKELKKTDFITLDPSDSFIAKETGYRLVKSNRSSRVAWADDPEKMDYFTFGSPEATVVDSLRDVIDMTAVELANEIVSSFLEKGDFRITALCTAGRPTPFLNKKDAPPDATGQVLKLANGVSISPCLIVGCGVLESKLQQKQQIQQQSQNTDKNIESLTSPFSSFVQNLNTVNKSIAISSEVIVPPPTPNNPPVSSTSNQKTAPPASAASDWSSATSFFTATNGGATTTAPPGGDENQYKPFLLVYKMEEVEDTVNHSNQLGPLNFGPGTSKTTKPRSINGESSTINLGGTTKTKKINWKQSNLSNKPNNAAFGANNLVPDFNQAASLPPISQQQQYHQQYNNEVDPNLHTPPGQTMDDEIYNGFLVGETFDSAADDEAEDNDPSAMGAASLYDLECEMANLTNLINNNTGASQGNNLSNPIATTGLLPTSFNDPLSSTAYDPEAPCPWAFDPDAASSTPDAPWDLVQGPAAIAESPASLSLPMQSFNDNSTNNNKPSANHVTGLANGGGVGGGVVSPPVDDLLKIEYTKPKINLTSLQCLRLPTVVSDWSFFVQSIVPATNGTGVYVVMNRSSASSSSSTNQQARSSAAGKGGATKQYSSAVLYYPLVVRTTSRSVGLQERPARQFFYHDDVGPIKTFLPLPKESMISIGSSSADQQDQQKSIDIDLILTENGDLLVVDDEDGQILTRATKNFGTENVKIESVAYISDDKIGAVSENGHIYVLEINSGLKRKEENLDEICDFNQEKRLDDFKDLELYVNKPLTYENMKNLWELTRSRVSSAGPQWSVQTPTCWLEVQQHQRLRKCPQHYLREEKMTRSWHIVTDNDTWKEHLFEINLPQSFCVNHLDFKFTLRQNTPGPPFVQVTLLHQLPRQPPGQKIDNQTKISENNAEFSALSQNLDNAGPSLNPKTASDGNGNGNGNGILKNRVLDPEFLHSLNAEIVSGPIDLAFGLDLSDQSGLIQFSSPLLLNMRNRTFYIHIQAISEESEAKKYKRSTVLHKKATRISDQSSLTKDTAKSLLAHQKYGSTKGGNVFTKYLQLGLKNSQKNLSDIVKMSDLKGCDWIQEISLTVWTARKTSPHNRKERMAILHNQDFHSNLISIFAAENTKLILTYPNFGCFQRLCLDILSYIISQTYANFWPILDNICKNFVTRLDDVLKCVFLSNSRTIARKFTVFCNFLYKTTKSVNEERAEELIANFKKSLLKFLEKISFSQSSGCVLWFFVLIEQFFKLNSTDFHLLNEQLLNLLKNLGEESSKKLTSLHQTLITKYGLCGLPFDLEMFELPFMSLQLVSKPQQPFSYAGAASHGTSLTANFVNQYENDEIDWTDIIGIEYNKNVKNPVLPSTIAAHSMSSSGGSRKGKLIRLDREHLYGLLEVEPLQFVCQSASDGIRLENLETGVSSTIQNGCIATSTGPGPIPIPDISQYENMQAGNPALANVVTSMKQQVQNILSKQMQLLALQQEKQKLQGNLQEQVAILNNITEQISTTQASSASTFGVPTTPKTTPFMTPTPLSPYQLSPASSEAIITNYESQSPTGDDASGPPTVINTGKEENLNLISLDLLKAPPPQALLIDPMNSGARKFVVLNFGRPVLLTDFILPQCSDIGSLSIDVWLKSENIDGYRLAVCTDIGRKCFVACDLQPPPLCQFLKITFIGRYGLGSCSSKIPLGSFFGYTYIQPWQLDIVDKEIMTADTRAGTNNHPSFLTSVPVFGYQSDFSISMDNLRQLAEDLRCRYSMACSFLKNLLEKPVRLWEVTKNDNLDVLIRDSYKECMQIKLQYNLIERTINRLANFNASTQLNFIENLTNFDQNLTNFDEKSTNFGQKFDFSTLPADKLRVISEIALGCLIRLAPWWKVAYPGLQQPLIQAPPLLDLNTAVKLFEQFCIKGIASLQALCTTWLLQQGSFTDWWGNFFVEILSKLESDWSDSKQHEKIFLIFSYLIERSINAGNDYLIYELLNRLDNILSQDDFSSHQKVKWIVMLLSNAFDYFPKCKIIGDHWNFALGEYSRSFCNTDYESRSRNKYDVSSHISSKSLNSTMEVIPEKVSFSADLSQYYSMEKPISSKPPTIKVSKSTSTTSAPATKSNLKVQKRSTRTGLRLPSSLCLSVVKKLIDRILNEENMQMNSENVVLFAKVLSTIARCARPYLHLLDVFDQSKIRAIIDSALTARNLSVRYSFLCLIQDFLEIEANCARKRTPGGGHVINFGAGQSLTSPGGPFQDLSSFNTGAVNLPSGPNNSNLKTQAAISNIVSSMTAQFAAEVPNFLETNGQKLTDSTGQYPVFKNKSDTDLTSSNFMQNLDSTDSKPVSSMPDTKEKSATPSAGAPSAAAAGAPHVSQVVAKSHTTPAHLNDSFSLPDTPSGAQQVIENLVSAVEPEPVTNPKIEIDINLRRKCLRMMCKETTYSNLASGCKFEHVKLWLKSVQSAERLFAQIALSIAQYEKQVQGHIQCCYKYGKTHLGGSKIAFMEFLDSAVASSVAGPSSASMFFLPPPASAIDISPMLVNSSAPGSLTMSMNLASSMAGPMTSLFMGQLPGISNVYNFGASSSSGSGSTASNLSQAKDNLAKFCEQLQSSAASAAMLTSPGQSSMSETALLDLGTLDVLAGLGNSPPGDLMNSTTKTTAGNNGDDSESSSGPVESEMDTITAQNLAISANDSTIQQPESSTGSTNHIKQENLDSSINVKEWPGIELDFLAEYSNSIQPVSLSVDERMEGQLGWRFEIEVRRSLLTYDSLLKWFLKKAVPVKKPSKTTSSLLKTASTNDSSSSLLAKKHVHQSSRLVLSHVINEIFAENVHKRTTSEFLENLLQFILSLCSKRSKKSAQDFSVGPNSVAILYEPFQICLNEISLDNLFKWLINAVDVPERLWALSFKLLTYCITTKVMSRVQEGLETKVIDFILSNERFSNLLRRFFATNGYFVSVGRGGPVVAQTFSSLLHEINYNMVFSDEKNLAISFKHNLIECLVESIGANWNAIDTFPLDVLTKMVEFLNIQTWKTVDLMLLTRFLSSLSSSLRYYLSSCVIFRQFTLPSGSGNPRFCFKLGKLDVGQNEFRSFHDKNDVFLLNSSKLLNKFIRSFTTTNFSSNKTRQVNVLSNLDNQETMFCEIFTEEFLIIDEEFDEETGQNRRCKLLAELLLDDVDRSRDVINTLLISLSNCFCDFSSSDDQNFAFNLGAASKKVAEIDDFNVATAADCVLLLLVGLFAKGHNAPLIIDCLTTYFRSETTVLAPRQALKMGHVTSKSVPRDQLGVSRDQLGVSRDQFGSSRDHAQKPRLLSDPIIAYFCFLIDHSHETRRRFIEFGGFEILAKKFVDSGLVVDNDFGHVTNLDNSQTAQAATSSTILLRKAASLCANLQKTQTESPSSAFNAVGPKKLTQQLETMTNYAPLCQITSSSPMAHHLTALLNNTPQHRRARSAAWSYHFYPAESWLDITLTLPYPVILKEIELRPHLAALQNCPGAVQVELSPDTEISSFFLLGPQIVTAGCTKIRISTECCTMPVQMVRLHLKRPPDSPNLGISQILLYGHSPVSTQNLDSQEKVQWLSLLHYCLKYDDFVRLLMKNGRFFQPDQSENVQNFDDQSETAIKINAQLKLTDLNNKKLLNSLINSLLFCRFSQKCLEQLIDCIVLLTPVDDVTSLEMIFKALDKGFTVTNDSEIWLVELFNNLFNVDVCLARLNALLTWNQRLLMNFIENTCKISNRTLSTLIWCSACIFYRSDSFSSINLPNNLIGCIKNAINECTFDSDLKLSFGYLLCAICSRHESEFLTLIRRMKFFDKFLPQNSAEFQHINHNLSQKLVKEIANLFVNDLLTFVNDLNLITVASENENCSKLLLKYKILHVLALALVNFCTKGLSNVHAILTLVNVFLKLSSQNSVKKWLLSSECPDFWMPLLNLLCQNCSTKFCQPQNNGPSNNVKNSASIQELENSAIQLLERCVSYQDPAGHKLISQLICNLLTKSGGGLSAFLQHLILRVLLEDERVEIVLEDKKSITNKIALTHPKFGFGIHRTVRELSSHTICQDLLPNIRKFPDTRAAKKPVNLSSLNAHSDTWLLYEAADKVKAKRLPGKLQSSSSVFSPINNKNQQQSSNIQPISFISCKNLNDDCLPGKVTLAQLICVLNQCSVANGGRSRDPSTSKSSYQPYFDCLHLDVSYGAPMDIDEKINESLINTKPNPVLLTSFAHMGGLAVLAQHLQLYQANMTIGNARSSYYSDNEIKIIEEIDNATSYNVAKQFLADDDVIDSYDTAYDWVTVMPPSSNDVMAAMDGNLTVKHERLKSVIRLGLSPHVDVCFGLFLRLPGYAEALVGQNSRQAQSLLRLALGVVTDGNGANILTNGDVSALTALPFDVLSRLYASKTWATEEGRILRQTSLDLSIVQALLSCLSAFSHHLPRRQLAPSEKPEVVRLLEQLLCSLSNNGNNVLQTPAAPNNGAASATTELATASVPSGGVATGTASGGSGVVGGILSSNQNSASGGVGGAPAQIGGGATGPANSVTNTVVQTVSTSTQSSDDKGGQYWAKGTGFGTGSTQRQWNIDLHLLKQKQDEQNITSLLKVLTNFIYSGDELESLALQFAQTSKNERADPDQQQCCTSKAAALFNPPSIPESHCLSRNMAKIIADSCLVATLQAYLRNDSVLDMSRHTPVYGAVMQIICAVALCPQLKSLLFEHTEQHSLKSLLYKLKECVNIYVSKLEPLKTENKENQGEECAVEEGLLKLVPLIELASHLIQIGDESEAGTSSRDEADKLAMHPSILSNEEKYMKLLKAFQYDSIKFFDSSNILCVPYHYESSIKNAASDSGALAPRVRRLAQEAVTLATSLPLSYSSSVFVRCAEERLDVMKVMITGPHGTPYSDGCFEFDVWFPADYPNSPMHINLQTTGGNTVRFNPNLYNDGKVCLSILNTWHGRPEERWNAQTSSFLQVLVSIQSLILVPDPYFNEPGYERTRGTPAGQQASKDYDINIRIATVRWAMLEMLRNPPAGFKQVIQRHFWIKRAEILKMIENWITEMSNDNSTTSEKRMQRTTSVQALKRHYYSLKEEFAKMTCPDGIVESQNSASNGPGSTKNDNEKK